MLTLNLQAQFYLRIWIGNKLKTITQGEVSTKVDKRLILCYATQLRVALENSMSICSITGFINFPVQMACKIIFLKNKTRRDYLLHFAVILYDTGSRLW